MGKLANSATQKKPNYKLVAEAESDAEHGFVEHGFVGNLCQIFALRDRLRKMRDEIHEIGFVIQFPSLMGNAVYNNTVYYKSSFFEKLMSPFIEELNSND